MERKICPLTTEFWGRGSVFFFASLLCWVTLGVRADDTKSEKRSTGSLVGDYYFGDGLGSNSLLQLAPNGTFRFSWAPDDDLPVHFWGTYLAGENGVIFTPAARLVSQRFTPSDFSLDLPFHPIKWGRRLYLLPVAQLADFCNAVNLGLEPRRGAYGMYYPRDPEWDVPADGPPPVPETASASSYSRDPSRERSRNESTIARLR